MEMRVVTFAGIGAFLLCLLSANAQVTTGTISGTVNDSTGAALPGAF